MFRSFRRTVFLPLALASLFFSTACLGSKYPSVLRVYSSSGVAGLKVELTSSMWLPAVEFLVQGPRPFWPVVDVRFRDFHLLVTTNGAKRMGLVAIPLWVPSFALLVAPAGAVVACRVRRRSARRLTVAVARRHPLAAAACHFLAAATVSASTHFLSNRWEDYLNSAAVGHWLWEHLITPLQGMPPAAVVVDTLVSSAPFLAGAAAVALAAARFPARLRFTLPAACVGYAYGPFLAHLLAGEPLSSVLYHFPSPFRADRLMASVLFAALGTSLALRRRRWMRRSRPSRRRCPNCRYNLTGNTSGVCPECGTPVAAKP